MIVIASDLDRTLIPNGNEPYDGSLPRFYALLKRIPESILVYVTGRSLELYQDAELEYDLEKPAYLLASVGTEVYVRDRDELVPDPDWDRYVLEQNPHWKRDAIVDYLAQSPHHYLQEDSVQNNFKVSYYIENPDTHGAEIIAKANRCTHVCGMETEVIFSVDPLKQLGLLDILPTHATKLGALQYLLGKLTLSKEDIVFCGDSGNDLLPLTSGMRAVLVGNAPEAVKLEAQKIAADMGISDRLYIASGTKGLNGNYASGVIEGLVHFGIAPQGA